MQRRRPTSRKPAKARHTTKPRQGSAAKAKRRASSIADLQDQIARQARELNEARERETATAEVLRVIGSSPGALEPVFQAMLENATRICEAHFGTLFHDGRNFHTVAQFGTPPELVELQRKRGPFRPAGRGFRHLMQGKEIVHTTDAAAEDASSPAVRYGGARSMIHVPIVKDDTLAGAFVIYRQEVQPFTDKQIALLKNFAAQAVIAIENTRLLNELCQRTADLTESLEQQTATSEVLRVISSSPGELDLVFQSMLANAVRICGARFGNLSLFDGKDLRIAAMHNAPPEYEDMRRGHPVISQGGTIGGPVIRRKKFIHIHELPRRELFITFSSRVG